MQWRVKEAVGPVLRGFLDFSNGGSREDTQGSEKKKHVDFERDLERGEVCDTREG